MAPPVVIRLNDQDSVVIARTTLLPGTEIAAGGLTMGADPVGHAIMRTAGDQDRAIDTFVVRKAQKSYGMGRQVEGPSVVGRNVVVVEDTSTTGGSALTAVEALPVSYTHLDVYKRQLRWVTTPPVRAVPRCSRAGPSGSRAP